MYSELACISQNSQPETRWAQFVHKELFQLKNMARSRTNFAVLLLRKFFQPSELEERNIAGARGKGKSIQFK